VDLNFYGMFYNYHPESVQLQLRRVGDLAFLLGHYELAYHSYHSAKKDFEANQAWLHYAGAMEMAALSVFLQNVHKLIIVPSRSTTSTKR
jgi:hypothetical protein